MTEVDSGKQSQILGLFNSGFSTI